MFARATRCTLGLGREYASSLAGASGESPRLHVELSSGDGLLCLAPPAPRLPQRAHSAGTGGIVSILFHIMVLTTVIAAGWVGAFRPSAPPAPAARQRLQLPRMVFLQIPGPGGGGGGGGNRQLKPPSRAHAVGHDRVTTPVTTSRRVGATEGCDASASSSRAGREAAGR